MASLKLSHIYKVYDNGHKAVNDFSIDIEDKEFIVFVGPSGCGKSTTLRMIAGLEKITAGDLFIGDTLVNDVMPKDRDIAMVFQNYALYPHMSVYENMAFGLRNRHIPEEEIKAKVEEAARILGITEYLDRKPKAMSGGQRQRVALGRAIVREPKVFLLDEPLSNLDAKLRAQMRTEISKLHKKLQTTFIYVTHDQVEAMTMGTRIVVMKLGFVQQIDTPMNLYNHPYNKFVAGFIGTPQMNFFDATLKREGDVVKATLPGGCSISVPFETLSKVHTDYLQGEKPVIFGIRPDHLVISKKKTPLYCHVNIVEHLGNECIIYAGLGESNEEQLVDQENQIIIKVKEGTPVEQGDTLYLDVDVDRIHLFDKETEITLMRDIPDYSKVPATVKEDKMTVFGKKVTMNPVYCSKLSMDVDLEIPPHAFIPGKDFTLPVHRVENVNGQHLAYLNYEDRYVFALVDENVKEGDKYSFSLAYDQIKVIDNDDNVVLEPIGKDEHFIGRFSKHEYHEDRERVIDFNYHIDDLVVAAPRVNGFKINQVEGNNCYKKNYRYVIDRDLINVSKEGEGLLATVTDVLDYGNRVYAMVQANGHELLVNYDRELGTDLVLNVNGEDIAVYQMEIDMRIC